jgi:hypothetical protein
VSGRQRRRAIAKTMPVGSLSKDVVNKLRAMRGPGESYSDVICGWRRSITRVTERVLTRKPRPIVYILPP